MSWPTLTIRLKQKVIDWLDYESRCNLRLSSKDDRDTVDSTVFVPAKLTITEMQSEMTPEKTIIRCDMDTLTIWLIGKENLTRIDRGWNGEIMEDASENKQENRYEIFNRFLSWISHKGVIEVGSVEVLATEFAPPENWKPKCQILKIFSIGDQHTPAWITSSILMNKKFKSLEIAYWGDVERIGTLLDDVEVSESLKLHHDTVWTDEQLEKIGATDLILSSNRITVDAAKRRVEQFLKLGRKGDCLELRIPKPENFDTEKDLLPANLKYKKFKKEDEVPGEFIGRIFGGFENIHGIQDPRDIEIMIFGDSMRIWCEIFEKSTTLCTLYPF